KYVTKWKLKNGTSVVLRPIKPEDETMLSELFNSFSEETMRFRFFQVIKEISHAMLTRYCNIDYSREIAVVAETGRGSKRRLTGVARIILQPDRKCGEFAVVVGDQWQGFGLGSKMLDYIIEVGNDLQLETICGDVMLSNAKMLNLCAKKGFKMEPVDEEVSRATLDLKA
ncbi:MAG: GNAT family N-acetyltransferase, partial [Candidatus Bathyarchaeota archaeon]|nr:GNAT family N-acetyltransferase [Candidatus Bathyarchaeota archaeon]